ncbi:MAG: four helix bundle protein [Prevotella sp.]|nr:four helix bundle protein [Prevotella sp.]
MGDDNQILRLSKAFALRIIKMSEYLFKSYQHNRTVYVLTDQVLRSGTSICANITESVDAQSTNDFISKLSIALKEADETKTWLELLHESDYLSKDSFESIYDDNEKIRAILIKIIKRMKEKKQ